MNMNAILRGMAGFFTLLSLALAHWHNPNWLWFTAFVGLNQLQSAFSGWCPAMWMLRRAGVRE
jgi:hypothetical protein